MKVEFIVDKNEYKKLLSKNKFSEQIKYSSEKIKGKNNYLLTLTCEGKSVSIAKTLSECRVTIEKLFADNNVKYRLLTEEASSFFVQRLYPYACEFETKLRKFIYTALFDIDEKAEKLATEKYKLTMLKKGDDKNFDKLPQSDFLSNSDLGQIFDFLFSNDEFLDEVKKINTNDNNNNRSYDRRLTKKEIIERIKNLEEKTIWNLLFAPNFADSHLPIIYGDLQKSRNDIMHMHYISYEDYIKAQRTYIKGIKDLDHQLNKGIIIDDTKINIDTLASSLSFFRQYLLNTPILQNAYNEALSQSILNYSGRLEAMSDLFKPSIEHFVKIKSTFPDTILSTRDTLSRLENLT